MPRYTAYTCCNRIGKLYSHNFIANSQLLFQYVRKYQPNQSAHLMTPRSIIALPNPELLVWARESMGLDHENVASRLKIQSATVQSWELGSKKPSLTQLRRLADIYKRPLAVFYLPERPRDFQPLKDFRRGASGVQSYQLP